MNQTDWVAKVRADFPILHTQMNGKPLVYLDNGATTQKPRAVIDAISRYYESDNANIHRGLYELSQRATDQFESARGTVARFLAATEPSECIFVRGTTEGINLVASGWGKTNLGPGDEVIVSGLEHHSNIVPWQMACSDSGAELKVWKSDDQGVLRLKTLETLLSDRTKFLSMQHVSNALGVVHDVKQATAMAHRAGAHVLVDGAQWIGHHPTDVAELGCDFYVFSGHKLFGPTGIGVLWGRKHLLEKIPPYQGGGDMIETVRFEKTTYAELPNRLEAGTPDIAGVIGLEAAIRYVEEIGFSNIQTHERELLKAATEQLKTVPGLRILGDVTCKEAVISFVLEDPAVAPLDVALHLSNAGIAIRTGHHCCMPLMEQLKVGGTCRVSFAFYNSVQDVEVLTNSLHELVAKQRQVSKMNSNPSKTEIAFAAKSSESISQAAAELEEEFLDFDDPESKTELLMELGQAVPDHFAALKEISELVPGCMSEVYLIGRPCPEDAERFEFAADSNAGIVRGLIGVLQHLFSGQKPGDILAYDLEGFFRRIGLHQFVSTQRRSGLAGMVNRIRSLAHGMEERTSS